MSPTDFFTLQFGWAEAPIVLDGNNNEKSDWGGSFNSAEPRWETHSFGKKSWKEEKVLMNWKQLMAIANEGCKKTFHVSKKIGKI